MSRPKPPPPAPLELQTIDPTALSHVSGGRGRAGGGAATTGGDAADPAVVNALTDILDSLKSIGANDRNSLRTEDLMVFMMMLNNGGTGGGGLSAPALIPITSKYHK